MRKHLNDKSKHVAMLMPVGGSGGVQRVMTNLANGLSDLGHEVHIICADGSGGLPDISGKVELYDLDMRRFRGDVNVIVSMREIRRALKEHHYPILLTAPGLSGQVGIAAARGLCTKVVVMVDNKISLLKRLSIKHRLSYAAAVRMYGRASAVVAAHDAALDDLRACLSWKVNAKLVRIYHPIVPDDIKAKESEAPDFSWDSSVPVVVAAGRLVDEKDFKTLIEAFAILCRKRPCRLVILGEGPLREDLDSLVSKLEIRECVSMPGNVENVYKYFSRSDVFALSSKREAFGNVLVEALACGVPCVATRCESGGPQEILADGKYGCLVDAGDKVALSIALSEVLDAPKSRQLLVKRGMEFSIKSSACAYSELFDKVC